MALRRLILSNLAHRKARTALTISAVTMAVALVVAVSTGFSSVLAAADLYLAQYLGSTDAVVTRRGDARGGVPESLVARLQQDPAVERVDGRLEMESGLLEKSGRADRGRAAQVVGIRRPQDTRVESLPMLRGEWFDSSTGNVAVIDQIAADDLHVDLGETFTLPGPNGSLQLKVVGIIRKPTLLAMMMQTIYVPLETLQQFVATPGVDVPQVTRVMINLRGGANMAGFQQRWSSHIEREHPDLMLSMSGEKREEMKRNLYGVRLVSYLGGTVAMLAATFIIFTSLSMGVLERARTMAMLRAVGAQQAQIGWLVVIEGALLAGIGAAIGAPLGWLAVQLIAWYPELTELFPSGVVIDWFGVAYGTLGSILAAVLASFMPAWSAMRADPLEAMAPHAAPTPRALPSLCAVAGLLLIALDPIVLFAPWTNWFSDGVARAIQFYGHFAVGLPGVMIGFFMLSPLFVWLIERVLGPIVAAIFGLRYALLRQQLSTGIWRAAGTATALMVGLSVLIVLQTQGRSMLQGWRLPNKFPDIFIVTYKFGGLLPDEQEKLANVEGIRPGELMPIAIASPELGSGFFAMAGAAFMPSATMFFGVDPDKAFEMMDLDFREGTPEQARELLRKGRHVVVTEEFRNLKGVGLGDTIPLKTMRHGVVDYTIAGVVWSPGIDVVVGMFDMGRQFEQRTLASVFGTVNDAREDFGVEGIHLFAANLNYHVEKEDVMRNVQRTLGAWGMKAGDVRHIKYRIQQAFERMLLLVSTVAFAAMAVASLGVMNTVMAGVRSRQWQFGILRSIGVTAGQVCRLVLAEAVLLGVIGVGLGLVAGLEMTVNARKLNVSISGYGPPLSIPWNMILIGSGIVMSISLLAGLWPAIRAARMEPLALLQAGRASA